MESKLLKSKIMPTNSIRDFLAVCCKKTSHS
jgi:hypothetical protein